MFFIKIIKYFKQLIQVFELHTIERERERERQIIINNKNTNNKEYKKINYQVFNSNVILTLSKPPSKYDDIRKSSFKFIFSQLLVYPCNVQLTNTYGNVYLMSAFYANFKR